MDTNISVPIPSGIVWWGACLVLPPKIEFGSPVQRGVNPTESFWHVPVKIFPRLWKTIGPATFGPCQIYLDLYSGDDVESSILLGWGDDMFGSFQNEFVLRNGAPVLVPLVWRAESDNDFSAYIANIVFLRDRLDKTNPVPAGTNKKRFRLRIKSGKKKYRSEHFYIIRVPNESSNSLFSVEIEYEGEGTRGD